MFRWEEIPLGKEGWNDGNLGILGGDCRTWSVRCRLRQEALSQVAPIREESVSDPGTAKLKTEPGLAGRSQVNGCVNGTTDFAGLNLTAVF